MLKLFWLAPYTVCYISFPGVRNARGIAHGWLLALL